MNNKDIQEPNGTEELGLDEPSIEELCQEHAPGLWRISSWIMWGLFVILIGLSIANNYRHASAAKSILSENDEISARVLDVNRVLKSGKYTDYSVDLELHKGDVTYVLNLDIPKDEFEANYDGAGTIPVVFESQEEFNLKSHYARRSNVLSNWAGILIGYTLVFVILFYARHFLIRFAYKGEGQVSDQA